MPTTDTVIVDPAGGGDYTLIDLAEAAERTDLQVADKVMVFECVAGNVENLNLTSATWNPDATRFIRIEAQSGSEHVGNASDTSGVTRMESGGNPILNVSLAHTKVTNMLIISTSTGTSADCIVIAGSITGTPTIIFQNVIAKMPTGTSTSNVYSVRSSFRGVNCVGMGGANCFTTEFMSAGSEWELFNSTMSGTNRGLLANDADGTGVMTSLYLNGTNTASFLINAGTASQTDVATNDALGTTGLQNIPFTTATFVAVTDAGDFDPHIADTDSALYDAGQDWSAFNGSITEDYEGGDRDSADAGAAWDIGADEFGVARGAVAAVAIANPRNLVPVRQLARRMGGFF